jgi:hypothetical protein
MRISEGLTIMETGRMQTHLVYIFLVLLSLLLWAV